MNEAAKTITCLATAAVALVAFWFSRPVEQADDTADETGAIFEPFDPRDAKTLEIVEYDESTTALRVFQIAQENGVWVIPSHENYPADAAQHLAGAANALNEAKKLRLASNDPATFETFGVVDPNPDRLQAGATGVGKRVELKNVEGRKLAQLIVGKQLADQPKQRYVRIPDQDQVYVSDVETAELSTKFEDWIEKDLLKLNAMNVQQLKINDYSVREGGRGATLDPRSRMLFDFDSKDAKWKLASLETFNADDQKYEPAEPAEDEELDSAKLNDLKFGLVDLKIVDVRRKPPGLGPDLTAQRDIMENQEAMQSLVVCGYYVAPSPFGEDKLEVFSNEGEVRCGTKEGVEYILRFGRIAGGGDEKEEKDESQKTDGKMAGLNRFLMISARFDEDLLTKPELPPLPEGVTDEEPEEEKDADKEDAKDGAQRSSDSDESAARPAGSGELYAALDPDEALALNDKDDRSTEQAGGDESGKNDADEAAKPDAGEPVADDKAAQEKPAEEKPAAATKPPTKAEIDAIRRTRKQKREAYDRQVKDGQKKADELAARFADWYYVISDTTYQKIHLGRDQVFKKKEQKKEPGADAAGDKTLDALKDLPGADEN